MARRERQNSNIDALLQVKMFAASSGWPYKPSWAPASPMVILTGGASEIPNYVSGKGHVCTRHLPLFRALLNPDLDHDDVVLVDLSLIATAAQWQEEIDHPGRATRMLAKWLVKFNPQNATVVALCEDAALLQAALRMQTEGQVQSAVDRVVLIGDGAGAKSRAQKLGEICRVSLVRPNLKSIRGAVTRRSQENAEVDLAKLFIVSVEFSLDPEQKHNHKQTPCDITASVISSRSPIDIYAESIGSFQKEAVSLTIDRLDFGMTIHSLKAQILSSVDAGDVIQVMLADPFASVEALMPKAWEISWQHGAIICLSGRVVAFAGRMVVLVQRAEPISRFRGDYKAVRLGQRNVSERDHRFGCIIVRSDKCVLARGDGCMEIPLAFPRGCESGTAAAVRATKEFCNIHQEEFAMLGDIAPIVAYDTSAQGRTKTNANDGSLANCRVTKLTVYAAIATAPALTEHKCSDCEPLDSTDPYEWCTFQEALMLFKTESERACMFKLTQAIAEAAHAGLLSSDAAMKQTEAFRPALPAAMSDLGFNQSLAIMAAEIKALTDGKNAHDNKSGNGREFCIPVTLAKKAKAKRVDNWSCGRDTWSCGKKACGKNGCGKKCC